MELPRSSDHANQREADKIQFIAALGWAAPATKLIGQPRRAPSPGPMGRGRGLDGDGALAHERDWHRMGAHPVARHAASGVGGAEEGGSMINTRRGVTVLFANMQDSMRLFADRDLEEARNILDQVVERMTEAVHHYGRP